MITFDNKTMEQFRRTLEDAEKEEREIQNRLEDLKSNIKALRVLLGDRNKYPGRPIGKSTTSFVSKVYKVLKDSKEALTASDVARTLIDQGEKCSATQIVTVLNYISKKKANQVECVSLGLYKFTGEST